MHIDICRDNIQWVDSFNDFFDQNFMDFFVFTKTVFKVYVVTLWVNGTFLTEVMNGNSLDYRNFYLSFFVFRTS